MKYDGGNLLEVIEAHKRWLSNGGENDEDRADFTGADLRHALLPGLDLSAAIFRGADLSRACLYDTDLTRADLTGANLYEADLFKTVLRGVIGMPFYPRFVPDTGSFIGWKRVGAAVPDGKDYDKSIIAKLLIPEYAKRESLFCGEYRADIVRVLELQTLKGETLPPETVGISLKDCKTLYRAGHMVFASDWRQDRLTHWLPGIYFYLDRQAAVCYCTKGGEDPKPITLEDIQNFPGFATPPEMQWGGEQVGQR